MAMPDYGQHDCLGLAELVRKGEVSPTELLDEALALWPGHQGLLAVRARNAADRAGGPAD